MSQFLESGEYGLSKDTDVVVWQHYRSYHKQPQLREVHEFVIVNSGLHDEFDKFKQEEIVPGYSLLEKVDLLDLYLQHNSYLTIPTVRRYGRVYLQFSLLDVDNLCQWLYKLREKFDLEGREAFHNPLSEGMECG